jgi:purine-cytosine permease-like protein
MDKKKPDFSKSINTALAYIFIANFLAGIMFIIAYYSTNKIWFLIAGLINIICGFVVILLVKSQSLKILKKLDNTAGESNENDR